MKKSAFVVTGLFLAFGAQASVGTFEEAAAVCDRHYQKIGATQDDGAATFPDGDRFNVAFERAGTRIVCSVGKSTGEIEQARAGKYTFSKEQLQRAAERHRAMSAEKEKVASGDHADFLKKAKRAISDKFKDPDSVKFRDLYLANKGLPTLCGEVNAKNSYGAYTGYKGFFYNSVSAHVDDGQELGSGFLYRELQPSSCKDKFADVAP